MVLPEQYVVWSLDFDTAYFALWLETARRLRKKNMAMSDSSTKLTPRSNFAEYSTLERKAPRPVSNQRYSQILSQRDAPIPTSAYPSDTHRVAYQLQCATKTVVMGITGASKMKTVTAITIIKTAASRSLM